ncbi:MAG: lipoyl synthase [Rikenellaceae bacterium]|nr:lipoyl synthase [Rikenellaceae bacterium]
MPKIYGKIRAEVKPHWLKTRIQAGEAFAETSSIVRRHSLHTICSSGRCPNKAECWGRKTATFMILGDVCTRGCRFCATATGTARAIDADEPRKVARSVALMGLRHAVITSVTRDDLSDGGARHWAQTIKTTREVNPESTIEVLIPDMQGNFEQLETILSARPDIAGHNIETVERLTPRVRSSADYRRSLSVLKYISGRGFTAKSGLMAGLGETIDEVLTTLDDLREAGCSILTIGQYLRPTAAHWPVAEYVTPETFEYYREQALLRGFSYVASAPLVRSSYMADKALGSCKKGKKDRIM